MQNSAYNSTKLKFDLDVLKFHPAFSMAEHITRRLHDQGFKSYLAGGCVRDALLSRIPNDLDIATNATPDQVEALFSKTVATGKEFGVIRVLAQSFPDITLGDFPVAKIEVEVATFRAEKDYVDGRHPSTVEWSSEKEDALRRDFTVNALFYDLIKNELVDFVGGVSDLENNILKTVGNPEERFFEDHLRILRALRFASEFNLNIDVDTKDAIQKNVSLVKTVSRERVKDELQKIIKGRRPLECFSNAEAWGFWQALFGISKSYFQENLSHEAFFKHQFLEDQWSLFFHFLTANNFDNTVMDRISLSKNEQKEVLAFAKYMREKSVWLGMKLSDQLLEWKNPSFRFFIQWLIAKKSENFDDAQKIFFEVTKRDLSENFPPPLFKGEDAQNLGLKGPAIGQVLNEAYGQQLEKGWTSKTQGLVWLKKYVDQLK